MIKTDRDDFSVVMVVSLGWATNLQLRRNPQMPQLQPGTLSPAGLRIREHFTRPTRKKSGSDHHQKPDPKSTRIWFRPNFENKVRSYFENRIQIRPKRSKTRIRIRNPSHHHLLKFKTIPTVHNEDILSIGAK